MTYRTGVPVAQSKVSPAPDGPVRHEFATPIGVIFITAPSWFKAREQLTGEDRDYAVCVSREDAPEAADVIAVGERWRGIEGSWSDDWCEEVEVEGE